VATGRLQLITAITMDGHPVRYIRITLTTSVGNWWSVSDVRAYAYNPGQRQ